MIQRYKEIIFGASLGAAMWIIDAAMHAQLGAEVHSSSGFIGELLHPGATQFLFRSFFLVIATILGWSLWRANWRERELRALEDAIIAFHRRLDSPAMRIVSNVRALRSRPGVMHDSLATNIVESIGDDARTIDELARGYIQFSEQVMAGRTSEAIKTLRAIESWTSEQQTLSSTANSAQPPSLSA